MTKAIFLSLYRERLEKMYDWAKDADKLERFMNHVSETISDKNTTWNFNTDTVQYVWKQMGMKGKVSLKRLRALR